MNTIDQKLQKPEDRQHKLALAAVNYLAICQKPTNNSNKNSKSTTWKVLVGIARAPEPVNMEQQDALAAVVKMMEENDITSVSRKDQKLRDILFPITSHFKARDRDKNKIKTEEKLKDEANNTLGIVTLYTAERNIKNHAVSDKGSEKLHKNMLLIKHALEEVSKPSADKSAEAEKLWEAWLECSLDMNQSAQLMHTELQRRGVVAENLPRAA